ncbi:hypothetical protein OAL00_00510 [Verrucomicrobiales bacterium]|nr:hypothetical protein [Verrucomicrobiales bacterium]
MVAVRHREPLDIPQQWGWSDEVEPLPEDRRGRAQRRMACPTSRSTMVGPWVLDVDDPFPADKGPVYQAD